jgi:hypothetical protein
MDIFIVILFLIIAVVVIYFTSLRPKSCTPTDKEKQPNVESYKRTWRFGACLPSKCEADFKLKDKKCDISDCVPTAQINNVKHYRLDSSNACVPYMCNDGYALKNSVCESSSSMTGLVLAALEKEVAKSGRVFVNSADTDKDFDLEQVTNGFIRAGKCGQSQDTIEKCAAEFVDYCDNNPEITRDPTFKLDCDQIVSNLGITCTSDSDCKSSTLKCKKSPNNLKSFCI